MDVTKPADETEGIELSPGLLCRHDQHDWSDSAVREQFERLRATLRADLPAVDRPEPLSRAFVETKAFLYDRRLYDPSAGRWRVEQFLDHGRQFGGFDQVILWPSYPRLGVDDRNQFDCFDVLPRHSGPDGPVEAAAYWVRVCHARGVRVLLAYNPWDRHTRRGDCHLADMVDLLRRCGADGVYLDTMHESPAGWPEALAEAVGRPVALECEGDPPPAALEHVHSSWGQGYAVDPPTQLYRTRWLTPQHKIFLTCNRHSRDHWNEVCAAFFTGAGVLVWENVFGNDTSWLDRDQQLLRALAPIQRAFWRHWQADDWQPFVPTADARLKANRYPGPDGALHVFHWPGDAEYAGPLLAVPPGSVCLDLIAGRAMPIVSGHVVGQVPGRSVAAVLVADRWTEPLRATMERVCPGRLPAFEPLSADRIPPPAQPDPRPACAATPTPCGGGPEASGEVVIVPPGRFLMRIEHPWHGSTCYGHHHWPKAGLPVELPGFAIDRFPVTNARFARFLQETGYRPADPRNFLRHWPAGRIPAGLEDHPVVFVSPADARAFAAWAGKRLPTEAEWQYAAGGPAGLTWPWGDRFESDPAKVNLSGRTQPVGQCAGDSSPFGLRDLVGHVWQWLDDTYTDEMNQFTVLKGGSFWRLPEQASRWYLPAGPMALTGHVKLAVLSDSTDRFATVGFRCAADVERVQDGR